MVFAFTCYIIITLGKSIYNNYQINQQISAINQEIEELFLVNETLANKIAYFKTDTYKELALRQKLNLQKPGEQMAVLPKRDDTSRKIIQIEKSNKSDVIKTPNYRLWIDYFKKGN